MFTRILPACGVFFNFLLYSKPMNIICLFVIVYYSENQTSIIQLFLLGCGSDVMRKMHTPPTN